MRGAESESLSWTMVAFVHHHGDLLCCDGREDSIPGKARPHQFSVCKRINASSVSRLQWILRVKNRVKVANPFLIIAGQMAPGNGIAIKGGLLGNRTHDVIIRHIRICPGQEAASSKGGDALLFVY